MTTWMTTLIFLVGLILCVVEVLTPGFGIFAISGVLCMAGSVFYMAPDLTTAIRNVVILLAILIICIPILIHVLGKLHFFDRLTVKKTMGDVSAASEKMRDYIGAEGIALTPLHPSGTIELSDGTRLDVVTRGDFIEKGEAVQVSKKDGTWFVVEKRRAKV